MDRVFDHDGKGVPNVLSEFEISGDQKSFVRKVQQADTVYGKHPDLTPEMTESDQVDRPLLVPELVGVHLPDAGLCVLQSLVGDFHPTLCGGSGEKLSQEISLVGVILGETDSDGEYPPEVLEGFPSPRIESGPDLANDRFEGGTEKGVPQFLEKTGPLPQDIKFQRGTDQRRDVLKTGDEGPVFPFPFPEIDHGKDSGERVQIPADGFDADPMLFGQCGGGCPLLIAEGIDDAELTFYLFFGHGRHLVPEC